MWILLLYVIFRIDPDIFLKRRYQSHALDEVLHLSRDDTEPI